MAVPAHTARRDLATAPPVGSGRGRPPKRPWHSGEAWRQRLAAAAWQRSNGRAGSTGPLIGAGGKRRVGSRTHRRQPGDAELVVGRRSRDRAQEPVVPGEASLANAAPETPVGACARVAKAAPRIAACLQRRKSAGGGADYEGRHGTGWQQQQTLA